MNSRLSGRSDSKVRSLKLLKKLKLHKSQINDYYATAFKTYYNPQWKEETIQSTLPKTTVTSLKSRNQFSHVTTSSQFMCRRPKKQKALYPTQRGSQQALKGNSKASRNIDKLYGSRTDGRAGVDQVDLRMPVVDERSMK